MTSNTDCDAPPAQNTDPARGPPSAPARCRGPPQRAAPGALGVLSAGTEVRPATALDVATIARIHAEGIAERVATFATAPPGAEKVERLIASDAIVLVAVHHGAVVAFAKVGPYDDPADNYSGVGEATLYVSRDAR